MTLFRRIRKRLLSGAEYGKYLKYAVGEIFLLAVGILLAIQANGWIAQQKDADLEKEYVCRLREDVRHDMQLVSDLQLQAQARVENSLNRRGTLHAGCPEPQAPGNNRGR